MIIAQSDFSSLGLVVTNIDIEGNPLFVATNPIQNLTFLISEEPLALSMINTTNDRIINSTHLPYDVDAIDVNPITDKLYLLSGREDTILVINGTTNEIMTEIDMPENPELLTVDPNSNLIYVVDRGTTYRTVENGTRVSTLDSELRTISVINGTTDKLIHNASIPHNIDDILVNPNTSSVYLVDNKDGSINIRDGDLKSTAPKIDLGGSQIEEIAVNTKNNIIYGINGDSSRVFAINGTSNKFISTFIVDNITVVDYSYRAGNIVVDSDRNVIYKTGGENDVLSIINGSNGQKSNIKVGKSPSDMAIDPLASKIYVVNEDSNSVSVINGSLALKQSGDKTAMVPGINVGDNPQDISINPITNTIYVVNEDSNSVSVINTSSGNKVRSYFLPHEMPWGNIDVNPSRDEIFTLSGWIDDANLTIIDGTTDQVIMDISLQEGDEVLSAGVSSDSDNIYVSFGQFLKQIDGNKEMKNQDLSNERTVNVSNIQFDEIEPITFSDYFEGLFGIERWSDTFSAIFVEKNDTGTYFIPQKKIAVGQNPSAVAVNPNTFTAYVTNEESNTVSVIDLYVDRVISNITVGKNPVDISVNPKTNKIYVANINDDTVSVLDGLYNKNLSTVKVGESPSAVAVNPNSNLIYVANSDSDTVSIIDGLTDKVVFPYNITFDVNPSNTGHIRCNGSDVPTNQPLRMQIDLQCKAEPNSGFSFISWAESVGPNSTRIISSSAPSDSPWNYLKTALDPLLSPFGLGLNENYSTFNVMRQGSFVANFEKVPPPIPPEYMLGIYTLAATVFTGWFVPNIARYINSSMQKKHMLEYFSDLNKLENANEKGEKLGLIKKQIIESYARGKISESHYKLLMEKISEREK